MTTPAPRRAPLRAAGWRVAAALLATAACTVPGPNRMLLPEPPSESAPEVQPTEETTRDVTAKPYVGFQVEQQAALQPGSAAPQFPRALRAAGTTGSVTVQFVVGVDGMGVEGTVTA